MSNFFWKKLNFRINYGREKLKRYRNGKIKEGFNLKPRFLPNLRREKEKKIKKLRKNM